MVTFSPMLSAAQRGAGSFRLPIAIGSAPSGRRIALELRDLQTQEVAPRAYPGLDWHLERGDAGGWTPRQPLRWAQRRGRKIAEIAADVR